MPSWNRAQGTGIFVIVMLPYEDLQQVVKKAQDRFQEVQIKRGGRTADETGFFRLRRIIEGSYVLG